MNFCLSKKQGLLNDPGRRNREEGTVKFIYVDESGDRDQGDVFTMCGLMVDAYKLRKKTADFDRKLESLFQKHPGNRADLKTSRFINGRGAWGNIDAQERKDLLTEICHLAVENGGKIFGIGLSFVSFDAACEAGHGQPMANNYWLAGAIFTSCLVQKKMQAVKNSKGLTVVIMDDNQREMPSLSNALHMCDPWFDGLYQVRGRRRGSTVWLPRKTSNRFDQIINTAFAIKSDHSSLVQIADAISYIYRRYLVLQAENEKWLGEKNYYQGLVDILEPSREKVGRCPDNHCVQFYRQSTHAGWTL